MLCLISFAVLFYLPSVELISNSKNDTAQVLFDLANYAVESRQQNRYPYPYPYYQKPVQNYYGFQQYPPPPPPSPPPQNLDYHQQGAKPYPPFRPSYFGSQQNYLGYPQRPSNQENIMDVLFSIARNDKLRCVPRLLCELTSDTLSAGRARQQSFGLPSLPINFDMQSIIGLLSSIDVGGVSPIPTFAKAAILGYASKGNADSCFSAYPTCPRDADRLVQYLNNYNGGFFRFFSGINPQQSSQNYGGNYGNYYPSNYPYSNLIAEQRIQNKPIQYITDSSNNNNGNDESFIFPTNNDGLSIKFNRAPKTLIFPSNDDEVNSYNQFTFRKPKELPYSIDHYYSNELKLQKPLPNHKATPMVFPDRTGTGDLVLDTEELNGNYKQSQYNLQNNNFISFNPLPTNEGFYYGAPKGVSNNNLYNKAVFSFPV